MKNIGCGQPEFVWVAIDSSFLNGKQYQKRS